MGASESSTENRRRLKPIQTCIVLVLVAVLVDGLVLAGWCAAFLPEGMLPAALAYHVSLTANFLVAFLAYTSLAAVPVALLTVPLSLAFRRHVWARKTCSWALVLLPVFALMASMTWIHRAVYWPVHHKAVRAVPPRAQGLVAAIERYKQDHGAPPSELSALLPDYLSEIPGTGVAGFPRFEYRLIADNESYTGRYELFMPCPYSYAGPSALLYWPGGNGYLVSWPQDAAQRRPDSDWVYVNMK